MTDLRTQLRPAFVALVILTLITGIIYPLIVTGLAQVIFPLRVTSGAFFSWPTNWPHAHSARATTHTRIFIAGS